MEEVAWEIVWNLPINLTWMIITIFIIFCFFVKINFSFAFLYFLPLLNKNSIIEIKEISTKQRQHNIGKIFWQIFLFSSIFFSWIWLLTSLTLDRTLIRKYCGILQNLSLFITKYISIQWCPSMILQKKSPLKSLWGLYF